MLEYTTLLAGAIYLLLAIFHYVQPKRVRFLKFRKHRYPMEMRKSGMAGQYFMLYAYFNIFCFTNAAIAISSYQEIPRLTSGFHWSFLIGNSFYFIWRIYYHLTMKKLRNTRFYIALLTFLVMFGCFVAPLTSKFVGAIMESFVEL